MLLLNPHRFLVASSLAFTFVASATANATGITIPASAAAGDFAILYDAAGGTGPASAVTPSGWTNHVNTTASNTMRCMISTKTLVGGEPGATINGMTGPTTSRKCMAVFRPSAAIATMTPSTPNAEGTTGDPALQNLLMSGQPTPLIAVACFRATTGITTRSVSPAFDGEITEDGSTIYMQYKIYNSGPFNHTVDMADFGTNCLQSMFFTFT